MINLVKIVKQQISDLKRHLSQVKHERDTAATPMESHSDQTRQVTDQLFHSLQDKLANFESLLSSLNKLPPFNSTAQTNTMVTLDTSSGQQKFLLVPEGLGGIKIDNTTLLSTNSTLATQFLNKKLRFQFDFNNQKYKIISIQPNN